MKLTRILPLSFLLAATLAGSAYAQAPVLAAGNYKLAIGANAPCDLTIDAGGVISQSAPCGGAAHLSKVKPSGSDYVLISASGEVFAVLKAHGDAFEGKTFLSAHTVVLSH